MSKFSRWTPTLGVCFKWDSQKVLKIAHFGVFRHIGGTWGVQKHMYLKIYWVKVISSKNGDFWTPQCWEIIFFRQNIGMFDWLYTETYPCQMEVGGSVGPSHFRISILTASLVALREKLKTCDLWDIWSEGWEDITTYLQTYQPTYITTYLPTYLPTSIRMIQLWFLELHDFPLELKGELQYLDENCHFRGEKMTILV